MHFGDKSLLDFYLEIRDLPFDDLLKVTGDF